MDGDDERMVMVHELFFIIGFQKIIFLHLFYEY